MQEMWIRMVIDKLKNEYQTIESYRLTLEAKMEELDMNSKDYADLDFEYNWSNGYTTALQFAIELLEEKE
jgi:hypothetical protein